MNYRKPSFWIIVAALGTCLVVAVCFLTDPNPSRDGVLVYRKGNNVSDLAPEAIVERIMDIEDIENDNVYTNSNNFSLTVDSNFNWIESQTVRYFFREDHKYRSAQLRIYPNEDRYFFTESRAWNEEERIFLLRSYLEAIKYLPQYEIQRMAPADQYIISHIESGRPSDYERVICYMQNGVKEIDSWFIHLQIQPLHADVDGFHGVDDEVIELFYGQTIAESLENTKIVIRNLHNGKDTTITDADDVESIVVFLDTVRGANPTSSKGYYGGSYQIQAFNGSEKIFSIGFGDDESFNYGDYGDGYPTRYELRGITKEKIIRFFSQYDSSGFDWGIDNENRLFDHPLVAYISSEWALDSKADNVELPFKKLMINEDGSGVIDGTKVTWKICDEFTSNQSIHIDVCTDSELIVSVVYWSKSQLLQIVDDNGNLLECYYHRIAYPTA